MPQVKGYNFAAFPAELKNVFDGRKEIIPDILANDFASLRDNFNTLVTDDKSPLVTLEVLDFARIAEDDFVPEESPLKFGARIPTFDDVDLDFQFTLDDLKTMYRSYLQYVKGLESERAVMENPFEVFYINEILRTHADNISVKAAWKGVKTAGQKGTDKVTDGLIKKTTEGRTSTDIPAAQVFTAATTIDVSNAYAQVNGVAALVQSQKPALLNVPLECRVGRDMYQLYRQNRRALFPDFVGPQENPTVLDDYTNISFKIDPGLAGKQTVVITPKSNLYFVTNEDVGAYRLKIVEDVKVWKCSIRLSYGFNYGVGKWVFLNNKV